jgi:threonine synthase
LRYRESFIVKGVQSSPAALHNVKFLPYNKPMNDLPDKTFNLIDNAIGQLPSVVKDIAELKEAASNPELDISERLDAFEDIIASEVGDTMLTRARNIEREVGLRQIYLKFEGGNPSGTQKDRIAFAQVLDALRRGYDTITFATCGNYGVAVSFAAALAGIQCRVFIPDTYHSPREKEMVRWGARIIRYGSSYEEAVIRSSREAKDEDLYDANPGGLNTDLQLRAYQEIAYEIYDELRDAPAAVAVPVSNGTTLAGIYRGFLNLYRRGKTSRIPRIIAGSSTNQNPIIVSYQKGLESCEDLDPASLRESLVNEPLINWHSIDGSMALMAIRQSNGWGDNSGDRKMSYYANFIRTHEGLSVLPASTAGLLALLMYHKKTPLPGDRYVVVLTGRR